MNRNNFDLLNILNALGKRRKFILFFTLVSLVVGWVFTLFQPKTYRSETTFIVKSPMTTDRNHLLRQGFYQNQEFFAGEDDLDHVMSIAQGSGLKSTLVENFQLADLHQDSKKRAYEALDDNMRVKRLETKSIEIRIEDHSPERAHQMVEAAYHLIESQYLNFFNSTHKGMVSALDSLCGKLEQEIDILSDSIQSLRGRYNLYTQLLPSRGTTLQSTPNINAEQAKGLEELQVLTTEKDKLLEDFARYASLKNEYALSLRNNRSDLLYRIEYPSYSKEPVKPILLLNLVIGLLGGFAFSCLLVLLAAAFGSGKPDA